MEQTVRPEVEAIITGTINLTRAAQEARKQLTLEQLDKMVDPLLELERESRNVRAAIAAFNKRYRIREGGE